VSNDVGTGVRATRKSSSRPYRSVASLLATGLLSGTEAGDAAARPARPFRTRAVFLLAFAAFFLISASWAIALPANGTNDENEHIIRAYGAASGQLYSAPAAATRGGGAWFSVPRSLLPVNVDCAQRCELPASCQQRPPDDPSRVQLASAAGRYNTLYYVPVGCRWCSAPTWP